MDAKNLQTNKAKKERNTGKVSYADRQMTGWETAENFHKTAKIDDGQGAKYSRLDNMDIYALKDELLADTDHKSYTYTAMQQSIEALTTLAASKGKIQEGDKKGNMADFFEVLFDAKQAVNQYLFNHAGYRWTAKGERRIQISLRLRKILNALDTEIEQKTAALSEEAQRRVEYDKEGLDEHEREEREKKFRAEKTAADIKRIIESGAYGDTGNIDPKELEKMGEKWVLGEYTEKLQSMINGKDELKDTEAMDEFLSFLEDQNNRLMANRMTVTILVDSAKGVTLDLPGLKDTLKQYLADRLTDDDMLIKPEELAAKVKTMIGEFKTDNEERITALSERKSKLVKTLHLTPGDKSIYDYPFVIQMLAEEGEADFEEKLDALKEQTEVNNKIITDILKDGFSLGTRASICLKLFKNLGPLRVFGTEEQIREQTYSFIEMLKYTAPKEYLAEKTLSNVMKDLGIDSLRRDSFLMEITNNNPEVLQEFKSDFWKIRGEDYSKRHIANSKTYAKTVDKKGLYLTSEQWDELEKLSLESGLKKESEFKTALLNVIKQKGQGTKLSRNEYITKRKFDDAKKEPARLKKAAEEQALLDKYEDKLNDRFITNITTGGEDPATFYRKLDVAYKGIKDPAVLDEETSKQLYDERISHVNHILQTAGFTTDKRKEFTEKCKWIISNIQETTEDMTDDERLTIERRNLEIFGVTTWSQALIRFEEVANAYQSEEGRKLIEHTHQRYEEGINVLKEYSDGRFADYAEILVGIPEIYGSMMTMTSDEFETFVAHTVEAKLSDLMSGLDEAKAVPTAVRKQFAYSYMRIAYNGNMVFDKTAFASQINDYYTKLLKIAPEGGSSIEDNIKAAEEYLKKDYAKRNIREADAIVYKVGVLSMFQDMMNDTESFRQLFDKDKVLELAKERTKEVENGVEVNKNSANVTINKLFTDEEEPFDTEKASAVENIKAQKSAGIKNRVKYLGIDLVKIEKIRLGKSLVRVGAKGANLVNLNTGKADSMRGRIQKYCGNLNLPPVLRDALVEEGASDSIKDRLTGIMWSDSELIRHATSMDKMYQLLRKQAPNDEPMSDEEAQMYIVKCYSDKSMRQIFTAKTGPNVNEIRETDDYKEFRANYAKIMRFEATESDDPSFERERLDMARNLRTMLITGEGIKGNAAVSDVIDRNIRYIERAKAITDIIRRNVEEDNKKRDLRSSDITKDRRVFAYRQYFLNKLVTDCKKNDEFDINRWEEEIASVFNNKLYRDNMEFNGDAITNTAYANAQKARIESNATEEDIADAIRANVHLFKGRINKYEKLDEDQKKFFAVALMLMDKGSIGMNTSGTSALLLPKEAKTRQTEEIEAELGKYIAGQPYSLNIDYREAFNKLVNYGETKALFIEGYALSRSAYDKALQFAQAILAKKQVFGEKDHERLTDGLSSINAAYTKYGKNQQQEVEKYRDEHLTTEDVRKTLLSYAQDDALTYGKVAKNTAKSFFSKRRMIGVLDEGIRIKKRMDNIINRLSKMDDAELKIFTRVMQERTLIDRTTTAQTPGGPEYADQEKRNAILEALCGNAETRAEVLTGFDDNESCHKAVITALSFQLRDDINFKGKDLTKDHFAGGAMDRKTLVDWELIERAIGFVDEVKERRASVYALQHATDFIEQSGNEKAIEENRKLENQFKDKESFSENDFETYIKQQADKDVEEQSDVSRIVAGYHSLSDKEKSLFFKVLARRDLLDVSKKDYKKSFFGVKDRDYVNQADRDKLIDEYINSSLEDNIGIQTQPGDHYNALKSLFSTQISDREKFDSEKKLKKMMAYERNLFMGRTTAIDWKLFRRALSFVNRATEELEYNEGNAQLYKGAGLLAQNGRMTMNYAFLRKNFHSTGNQWGRYVGRYIVKSAAEEIGADGILETVVDAAGIASGIASKIIGLSNQGMFGKGFNIVKNQAISLRADLKGVGQNVTDYKVSVPKVREKEKTKEDLEEEEKAKAEEKERRDNLLYYEHLKEGIDNVVAHSKSVYNAGVDVAKFIRDNYATRFEADKQRTVIDKTVKADEGNLVNKMTKGTAMDTSKGDVRDTVNKTIDTTKSIKNTVKDVSGIIDKVPGLNTLQDLALYGAEKATLQFINDKILKVSTDLTKVDGNLSTAERFKKESELLKRSSEEYADSVFKEIVEGVIGEEKAKDLLNLENGYYSMKIDIEKQIKGVLETINYAKKCVGNVKDIAKSAKSLVELSDVQGIASEKRAEDDKKLEKASQKRLSPEQAAKVDKIVKKHRGLSGLSGDITKAVLSFKISEDVLNIALDTTTVMGDKYNVPNDVIAKSIKAGIDFAMFATRIMTDRNALNNYFTETDAGKAVVNKVRGGFAKAGNEEMVKKIDKRMESHAGSKIDINTSLVDIISDARGYEHTSELVENTGMSMAQSLVFSASKYNPMEETRLIAVTVMSIMGLTDRIGDTSPETVEKLFNAFRMKR